jgi:5-methylcytosine-specific restriction endonuclease McrA
MSVLQERVLVLNRSWRPISVTSVRNAVTLVCQDAAKFVDPESYATFDFESWKDAAAFARDAVRFLRGSSWKILVPEVIVLSRYNGINKRQVKFSRRNIYHRDRNTCQYCGRTFRTQELTLDHVLPRSRGGRSTWENVVVACCDCNRRKDDRMPAETGLRLIRKPVRPQWQEVRVTSRVDGRIPASWEAFLSQMYWDQELKE